MTNKNFGSNGNGKRDRTPLPVGLKKIKRVSSAVFLSLKELIDNTKVYASITPRGNRKKSKLTYKKPGVPIQRYTRKYEPSNIINIYNSPYQRWRRVIEWDRYINDPCEKTNGHIITKIC